MNVQEVISQPLIVQDYNTNMGGVDKSNQMLNQYQCYIKSIFHWWKVLFFNSIDIMVVNSYIILKVFMKDKVNESSVNGVSASFGQLEYRESLAMSLMGLALNRKLAPSPKPSVDQCLSMISKHRRDCICCNGEASVLGQKIPSTKPTITIRNVKCNFVFREKETVFLSGILQTGMSFKIWQGQRAEKGNVELRYVIILEIQT